MLQNLTSLRARMAGSAFFVLGAVVAANLFFFQEKRRVGPVETAALTARMTQDSQAAQTYANGAPIVLRPAAGATTQMQVQSPAIARPGSDLAMSRVDVVRGIQRELGTRGYAPGAPDGVPGLVTRAAVMAFEHDNGIALSGEPTQELLGRIVLGAAVPAVARPGKSEVKGTEAAAVVKVVAQSLAAQGYAVAKSEGGVDTTLVKAIRDFEEVQKLPVTGRISAVLVSRLLRLQGQTRAAAQR